MVVRARAHTRVPNKGALRNFVKSVYRYSKRNVRITGRFWDRVCLELATGLGK